MPEIHTIDTNEIEESVETLLKAEWCPNDTKTKWLNSLSWDVYEVERAMNGSKLINQKVLALLSLQIWTICHTLTRFSIDQVRLVWTCVLMFMTLFSNSSS